MRLSISATLAAFVLCASAVAPTVPTASAWAPGPGCDASRVTEGLMGSTYDKDKKIYKFDVTLRNPSQQPVQAKVEFVNFPRGFSAAGKTDLRLAPGASKVFSIGTNTRLEPYSSDMRITYNKAGSGPSILITNCVSMSAGS